MKRRTKHLVKQEVRRTLDLHHNKALKSASEIDKKQKKLEEMRVKLQKEYDEIDQLKTSSLSQDKFNRKLEIKDQLININNQINNIGANTTTYLKNNAFLLFEYYESQNQNNQDLDNNNGILQFLVQDNQKNKSIKSDTELNIRDRDSIVQEFAIQNNKFEEIAQTNKSIFIQQENICPECNLQLLLYPSDGIYICSGCGYISEKTLEQETPSYKDPPREVNSFAYKRINHFNEWLAKFQAKQSTEIPYKVLDRIRKELQKDRCLDMRLLTRERLKQVLQQLELSKYYDNIPHILNRLNGQATKVFSPAVEEKLRSMFREMQIPYMKHMPSDRKNFLYYGYVLFKFLQLLEMDDYLKRFSLLKTRDKLYEQDQVWKKICEDVQWEYIPSV